MAVIQRPFAFWLARAWCTRQPTVYARSMIAFWNCASVTLDPVQWDRSVPQAERLVAVVTQAVLAVLDGGQAV